MKKAATSLKRLTPEVLEKRILKIVRDKRNFVLDLNRKQLFSGELSDGEKITPKYASDSYARYKLKKNPRGVVDLKLTGKFYDSFFLQANTFPVYIFASDEKTRMLAGKYGSEIFGINDKNLDKLAADYIIPEIQKIIQEALRVR